MESSLTIDAGVALLGRRLTEVPDARIVCRGGRIVACGPRREVAVPPGSQRADAGALVVLPGFIDAHVHLGLVDPAAVLAGGVTTVRDLGWPLAQIRSLAAAGEDAAALSPLVLFAGRMLTAPGGYPSRSSWAPRGTAREVTGPEDAAGAVDEQIDSGSSIVKITLDPAGGPVLDDATLGSVVTTTHARGLQVTAHVRGLEQLQRALAAGIDELAHMPMGPETFPDEVLAHMARAGVVVVPTLSVRFGDQEIALDNLRRFLAAGGRLVYGTDLGDVGPVPGIDPREVDALGRAGLTPAAVVHSATVAAAEWLGLAAKGVIAPGKDADLVAVPPAALAEHAALTDVRAVWRAARRVR